MRFQIIAEYNICGNICECLCTTATKSGAWSICYDENMAKERVTELEALGVKAYYAEAPQGSMWFDDENYYG